MQLKINGKTIDVPPSRLDEIRAVYLEMEHIALPQNGIRLVFRESDAAETPTQANKQEVAD